MCHIRVSEDLGYRRTVNWMACGGSGRGRCLYLGVFVRVLVLCMRCFGRMLASTHCIKSTEIRRLKRFEGLP